MEQEKRCTTKIQPKAVAGDISFNFDKCRKKIAGDAISGRAVDYVSLDAYVKFGESRLNSGRTIGVLVAGQTRLRTFVQNLIAFCSR